MLVDYIDNFASAEKLCDKFGQIVKDVFFKSGSVTVCTINYCETAYYLQLLTPVKSCVQLFALLKLPNLEEQETFFYKRAGSLEDSTKVTKLSDFESCLETVKLGFILATNERLSFSKAFNDEEKQRMNEAIHDYFEDCHYSCVAMSVSVVETRLLRLMCLACPESTQELEGKTFGQLIGEYDKNKAKYQNIVPDRHEPLLDLCNKYRIFSIHTKPQVITRRLASLVLTSTLEFMIDEDTRPEIVKTKLTLANSK